MKTTATIIVLLAMVSCSARRTTTRDHYEASNVSSESFRMDSTYFRCDWSRSADRTITVQYWSSPDSSGSQHVTATARIKESVSEKSESYATESSVSEAKRDSVVVISDSRKTDIRTSNKLTDILIGAAISALIIAMIIFAPSKTER